MLVCAFLCAACTRDRGCSAHPAFPAPSSLSEGIRLQNLGRFAPRDRGHVDNRLAHEISYTDTLSAMPPNATLLRVDVSPLASSSVRVSAFSTTDSVTTIER